MVRLADEQTPHEHRDSLRESAEIRLWIKDHRNPHTANLQFEQLELFCRRSGKTPEDLVRLASQTPNREFRSVVLEWVEAQRKEGRPDQYLRSIWFAIKSWLRHNEVKVEWRPPFNVQAAATLTKERIPTNEELRRLLTVLNLRDRAAVLFMTSSGVRIGSLADRFEAGGLTLADLPDLQIGKGRPKFKALPAVVHVPANRAKGLQEYYTFIGSEAAEALADYLAARVARKEHLGPGSPVIAPEPKASRSHFRASREGSLFISGKSLGHAIRVGLRKVIPKGVRIRPHTLRKWTSSNLERAEREGLITKTIREYFMGHDLKSIDGRYNVGMKLDSDRIEELRESYRKVERFVSTSPPKGETQVNDPVLRKGILMAVGYTEADVEGMKVAGMPTEKFLEAIKNSPIRGGAASGPKQQIIPEAEVPKYLSQGWMLKMPFNHGSYVVERV